MERDTIFISHATPGDNDFVRWLAGQLTDRGYTIWADIFHLKGGTPFWSAIEEVLRQRTIKVIFVVSKHSVDLGRGGVRNELSVADGLRKSLGDPTFIVPVRIDDTPFENLPIQVHQLNTLDFADNWEARLALLLDTLESAGVPRTIPAPAPPVELANSPGSDPAAAAKVPRERPAIAVLPFHNLSGEREQDYFADGMVDEIITGLSRIKWLFVISRNSTFAYRGKPLDVKTVGRELGVRYVLEGSVRRAGNQVRVTGQLIETETAAHVWADRYDGTLDDLFALQDRLTMSVIGAVEPSLRKVEIERALRKRPDSLDAYDLYLRALPHAATAMPEHADRAVELLDAAIRLEPNYAIAHGYLAWCHEQRYFRAGLDPKVRELAIHHAQAAIEGGSDDATALATGGFVIGGVGGDFETAVDALDRSIALSPSSALAFGLSSVIRAWVGDYQIAIEHAQMGIRLGPHDPLVYLPYVGLAYAHFFAGNFVEAAAAGRRGLAANPKFSVPCYLQVASLARLGRLEEASAMARLLLELQPGFTVSSLILGYLSDRGRLKMIGDALLEAGLPA